VSLTEQHVVVLVTGISAAGKTTVSELLARRFDRAVHVRGDVFRRMVVAGRADMTADPSPEALRQLRLRYALGAATSDAYFGEGFSVVVQDIVLGPMVQDYVAMIESRPLCVVTLAQRLDAVAVREASRDKVAYRPGFESIAALDEALRRDTPRIGLWLDTSEQTPDETVDEVVARAWEEARVT
jgi:chloramphenicol 3-O-phosphotransferase